MKRFLSLVLVLVCLVPVLCLTVSAEEDKELTRILNYCINNSIINENEKEELLTGDSVELGTVALLVARIAEADTVIADSEVSVQKQQAYDWCLENGIISVPEGGTYDPTVVISREEFAVIVYNLEHYNFNATDDSAAGALDVFKDKDSVSEENLTEMEIAVDKGYLSSEKVISPKDAISSKDMLKGLMKLDQNLTSASKKDETPVQNESSDKDKAPVTESKKPNMMLKVTKSLGKGFVSTLELFAVTLLFALPLGLIFSFASMSRFKPLKWFMKIFIWIIRGTPLMLQLIIIYYGPGLLGAWADGVLKANPTLDIFVPNIFLDVIEKLCYYVVSWFSTWTVWDRFFAVSVAFVINYACYFSEIYRGGIESISKGQYEAGQVLGMTKIQVFFRVILLQVVKRIIPPMSNEIITLVKDTSLSRIIAVYEIIWAGQAFIKSDGLLWPLFYTGAFYLIFNGILTILFGKLEKKLDYFRG